MKNSDTNICPHCGKSIAPITIQSHNYNYKFHDKSQKGNDDLSVYQCPSCSLHYLVVKTIVVKSISNLNVKVDLIYPSPNKIFDQIINDISPNFINIYNQSASAETNNLDEIAGMGYRKSVEFLIKDYLIKKYPDYKEQFIKSPISQCIQNKTKESDKNYLPSINSPYLNEISKRIIWLGNDETHYSRKHTDRDISDLKALIDIAIQHIILEYKTNGYIEEIQPK
jgi:hypothetical protein